MRPSLRKLHAVNFDAVRFVACVFAVVFFTACSGGKSDSNAGAGTESGVFNFEGVGRVTPNNDGTWTAWWRTVVGVPNLKYLVYTRSGDESYNFDKPVITIENTHSTGDLRLVGNTCFIVRYSQEGNAPDVNTKEICTNHEPYKFDGVTELVSLRDGTYMLKWAEPEFAGAQFQVFSRLKTEVEWKPLAVTKDAFFKTEKVNLDTPFCYRVRYQIQGFPADENQKEICTPALDDGRFGGVQELSSPGKGKIRVKWTPLSSENVSGYNIYLGTDFKQKVASIAGKEIGEHTISDLLHAVVYTVGVRAVDIYGREDKNANVISYELRNHFPVITRVELKVLESNLVGKPTKMRCETDFQDEDDWQQLRSSFWIKNEKRMNLGLVERLVVEGRIDQRSIEYSVLPDDVRADQIFCEVRVHDGFNNSAIVRSAPYVIPDTPVIGTGLNLVTLQNTEIDIVITRGTGQGYIDADQDDAVEVTYTQTNGAFISSPPLTCIDGTCTGRFKPDLGFYTNSDSPTPEYATISYSVRAGDSVSEVKDILINVLPVPRAINFDMIAQQDEDRPGAVGVADEYVGQDKMVFTGYTHILAKDASRIIFRQPLSESVYNGKMVLPVGMSENLAAKTYCKAMPIPSGWTTKPGFECSIPCTDGKCPFVFRPETNYYGPAQVDFAVEVNNLISNYATAIIEVLPNLRATGFIGLTVEGQPFTIEMKNGKGMLGAETGLRIDNIVITNAAGTASNPPFTCSDSSGEWVCTATYVPDSGFKGDAAFNYQISATNMSTGQSIISNLGNGTIKFYAYPVATGLSISAIENAPRTHSIALSAGYSHMLNDQAKSINIKNVVVGLGFVQHANLGSGITSGSIPCTAGSCPFTFVRNADQWDNSGAMYRKFDYEVVTVVNPDLFTNPNIYIDAWLENVSNRTLVSMPAQADINFRPRPDVLQQQYYVREFSPTYPTSLSVAIASPASYTHDLGYRAAAVDFSVQPASGTFGNPKFTCDVLGVCTGVYTPVTGVIGELLPHAQYFVTTIDPLYTLNGGKIDSFPAEMRIEVRPAPKGTGLALNMIENADFSPTYQDVVIQSGSGLGYTHAGGLPAVEAVITPTNPAVPGAFSAMNCVGGTCTQRFTPTLNSYGMRQMEYVVRINDPLLTPNLQPSEPASLNIDVRPRPRAYPVGALAAPVRVDENKTKVFNLDAGAAPGELQYFHPYAIPVTEVEIVAATQALDTSWECPVGASPTGRCTISYTPSLNYEGPAYIDYKVKVMDPKLNVLLESNVARIFIDVYPAPRATNRHTYVLATVPTDIFLDLRPKVEIAPDLNEDSILSWVQRKGYAHRRDDLATVITNVTTPPLARGTFETGWSCQGIPDLNPGLCKARYKSGLYDSNFQYDDFSYKVTVGGTESNVGTYRIEVIPTAIANNFTVVTKENEDEVVDFQLDDQYSHPTNEYARRIEILSAHHGVVVDGLAPIDAGTMLPCDYSSVFRCTVVFQPDPGYSTPDVNPTEAYFEYRVWTYNLQLNQEVPSNTGRVVVNVRPKPKAPNLTFLQIEGLNQPVTINPGPGAGQYQYATGSGRVDKVVIVPSSNLNGTVTPSTELTCNSGSCGPLAFNPTPIDYWGDNAKFQYRLAVNDPALPALENPVLSDIAQVTIRYRPKPKLVPKHFITWQDVNAPIAIAKGADPVTGGYTHPLFGANVLTLDPLVRPDSSTEGSFVGGFNCAVAETCNSVFDPVTSYYWLSGDFLKFKYTISVIDPEWPNGPIVSDPVTSTIEVRPKVFNIGKTGIQKEYGVQTVQHPLRLEPGNGYQFPPGATLSNAPVVTITTALDPSKVVLVAADGITLASTFDCTTAGCDAFLRPVGNFTGDYSFDYKMTIYDELNGAPPLESYDTDIRTYTVSFYPRPVATAFGRPNHFKGIQGSNKSIVIAPGNGGTYCTPAHAGLTHSVGYSNGLCDRAVSAEVVAPIENVAAFALSCTDGLCQGVAAATAPGGSWPGYGDASFQYTVTIAPAILDGKLTPAERAKLTSDPVTAVVEYYPLPIASGLRDTPNTFIYAIENSDRNINFSICEDTPVGDCALGYVHPMFNERATSVTVPVKNNVDVKNISCTSVNCSATLSPALAYYSPKVGMTYTPATFAYHVTIPGPVGPISSSPNKQVDVVVYPKPKVDRPASAYVAYTLEGNEVEVTIDLNTQYTHPYGDPAIKIDMPLSPTKGTFLSGPAGAPVVDSNNAFVCNPAGRCSAWYKPNLGQKGTDTFAFKVRLAGPPDMPGFLASQLVEPNIAKTYTVEILPKPTAQDLEVVVAEDVLKLFTIQKGAGKGYDHETTGVTATRLDFFGGSSDGGKVIVSDLNDQGRLIGTDISCPGGNCQVTCVPDGVCDMSFDDSATWNPSSAVAGACNETCPYLEFKPVVQVGPTQLEATSDNAAKMFFNIRPRPRTPGAPLDYMQAEGEPIELSITAGTGYTHPFYEASRIAIDSVTHSANSAASTNFTCIADTCTWNFTPAPGFSPTLADRYAYVNYRPVVNDPTNRTHGETGPVGELDSPAAGQIRIEYRPKPKTTSFSGKLVQGNKKQFTIRRTEGFTTTAGYERPAKNLIILQNSNQNLNITGCNLVSADCVIACPAGDCTFEVDPAPGHYNPTNGSAGTARFFYHVVVEDNAFSPARDLQSISSGTAVFDVRPLPVGQDLTFKLRQKSDIPVVLKQLAGQGYLHPYGYPAKAFFVDNAPTNGSLSTPVTCQTDPGPTQGQCAGVYTPNTSFFGQDTVQYHVRVNDPVIGQDIDSLIKTITFVVRPLPVVDAAEVTFATRENANRTLTLSEGLSAFGQQYFYPEAYELHPTSIDVLAPAPSGVGTLGTWSCTTGLALPRGCSSLFTVAPNTFGATSLNYRVRIEDPVLGSGEEVVSNNGSVKIDVRPIIRANDVSYATNVKFKAIENRTLSWEIKNGADLGYTYPVTYPIPLATLELIAANEANGDANFNAWTSCGGLTCAGTFDPTPGYKSDLGNPADRASFKFKVRVTDVVLPLADRVIESEERTALIDVYPLPVPHDRVFYTVEGSPAAIQIGRGAGSGFTHLRNHDPSGIVVGALTNHDPADPLVDGDFTCVGSNCTAPFNLSPGFKSANESNFATAKFRVTVAEPDGGRQPTSDVEGTLNVVAYPLPVANSGALFTNMVAWEGEAALVTLNENSNPGDGFGYFHLWGHKAQDIQPATTVAGTLTAWSCVDGSCSASYTPNLGSIPAHYGPGKGSFTYRVRTDYAQLAVPEVWSANTAPVTFNVRAKAFVEATRTYETFVENASGATDYTGINGATVSLNDGYTYNFGVNQVTKIKLREYIPSKNASCFGGCAVNGVACAAGVCTLPRIDTTLDKNRATGDDVRLQYAVLVEDDHDGNPLTPVLEKWSDWGDLVFSLLPRARGEELSMMSGVEQTPFGLDIERGAVGQFKGYTHRENLPATQIRILGGADAPINLSSPAADQVINCDAGGKCELTLVPIATTFADVPSKTGDKGNGFGWTKIVYQVKVPTSGQDIWSTPGTAYVYFRPAPTASPFTITNATEAESYTVQIALGSGLGYTHQLNGKAESITVPLGRATAAVEQASCNSGSGICTVKFKSEVPGTFSFDYKVTVDGVEQMEWGTISVDFRARHRTNPVSLTMIEGDALNIDFNRGSQYTHNPGTGDNEYAQSIIVKRATLTNVQEPLKYWDGGQEVDCQLEGGTLYVCACQATTCRIVFRHSPSWVQAGANPNLMSAGFSYKTRAQNYFETDGSHLLDAMNESSVSVAVDARIVANSRNYPAGIHEGEELKVKPVELEDGAGDLIAGGYIHRKNLPGTTVRVLSVTGATIASPSCVGGPPCSVACVAGLCTVDVNPLLNAAFVTNASFTYKIQDADGFESHNIGSSAVYFFPLPKANTVNAIVLANDPTENPNPGSTLQLQRSPTGGYTHLLNNAANAWELVDDTNAGGTLPPASFTCTGTGACAVTFEPNQVSGAADYSVNNLDLFSFTYDVKINAPHGVVKSPVPGTYNIEIYPAPKATSSLVLKWIEGEGDIANAPNNYRISLIRGSQWTHRLNYDASDVVPTVLAGGAFTGELCTGNACFLTFSPSGVSPNAGVAAAQATWKISADNGSNRYKNFYSNEETIAIHIFPKPKLPLPGQEVRVANAVQGETLTFKLGNTAVPGDPVDNDPPVQYAAFSHIWADPGVYIDSLTILSQPRIDGSTVGTISVDSCSGMVCTLNFVPNPAQLQKTGEAVFTYDVKVKHATWGEASTGNGSGFITIRPYIVATGATFNAPQSIDYGPPIPVVNNGSYSGIVLEHDVGPDPHGFKNINNNPNAAAQIRFLSVSQGTIETNNGSLLVVGNLPPNGQGKARFENLSLSTNPFQWRADFVGQNYFFGELSIQYQICEKTPCTDPTSRNTPIETDQTKWLKIVVDPADIPPTACAKNGGGSAIFYQGIPKVITLNKGEACDNGKWIVDANESDVLKEISFLGAGGYSIPGGMTVNGVAGFSTCSNVGADRVCRCTQPALETCKISVTMTGSVGDKQVAYHVKTLSSLINAEAQSSAPAVSNFKVVAPMAPVAKNFTVNTNEDIPPVVSVNVNVGYFPVDDVSMPYGAILLPAPDGYRMIADELRVMSATSNVASYEVQACTPIGECPISVLLKDDVYTVGAVPAVTVSLDYQIKANGVWSATRKITFSVDPVDDGPNEYRNVVTDRAYRRLNYFYSDGGWLRNEGTFYHPADWFEPGVPATPESVPVTVYIQPFLGATPQIYTHSNTQGSFYGYFDVEGDLATSIRTGPVTGGTLTPFVCGAAASIPNGHCRATYTPNGSLAFNGSGHYIGTFNYWVTAGGKEQAAPSIAQIYVYNGDPNPPVAKDLPVGMASPNVNASDYPEDFTVARGATRRLTIRRGPGDAYTKAAWGTYENTVDATSIQICDGTGGCPAAPVNVEITSSDFVCAFGVCDANVKALDTYTGNYPFEGVFYYRVVTNENVVALTGVPADYEFNHHLVRYSAWKKVTMKVVQTLNGGCEDQPILSENNFLDRTQFAPGGILQGTEVLFRVGAVDGSGNPTSGNGYSHSGAGPKWRRLQNVEIISTQNGSIAPADVNCNIPGQAGRCEVKFVPSGAGNGTENDDFIGHWATVRLRAIDDNGCYSAPQNWYINFSPRVATRNVCTFDFFNDRDCFNDAAHLNATSSSMATTLTFRKKGAKAYTEYGAYEYQTFDNANATKVVLKNFRTTQVGIDVEDLLKVPHQTAAVTGDGVSCSGSLGGGNFECTIQGLGCVAGTCQATLNPTTGTNWGMVQFDYDVYVGDTYSRAHWVRLPGYFWPTTYNMSDNQYWVTGATRYDVFVKARPVPTNPSDYKTSVNTPITIKLGKQNLPQIDGYTYDDEVNFSGKDITITVESVTNGTLTSSSFDQSTKVLTVTVQPNLDFDGFINLEYRVNVWGVPSTLGNAAINVRKHLKANNATFTFERNEPSAQRALVKGTAFEKHGVHAFGNGITVEIKNDNLTALDGSKGVFSLLGCETGGSGNCQFNYQPPEDFVGTHNFKYRVRGGDPGVDETWSNWASLQVDVIQSPEPPVAYPLTVAGNDVDPVIILVSTGALNGYTDANGDKATFIKFQNLSGGSIIEDSPHACNGAGICALTFMASASGTASFEYAVRDADSGYSNWETVTLNIEPALKAQNLTMAASRNVTKVVKVNLNDGYIYSAGALGTDDKIAVDQVTNGTVTGSPFFCKASGVCEFNFVPTADFVGTATLKFQVQDWAGGLFVRQSDWKTITINVTNDDEAPVATNFAVTLPDRAALAPIAINLGTQYTDREGDEATVVTVITQTGGTAIFDQCVSGNCIVRFSPQESPSFSGEAKLTYRVTANGKQSNTGTISLTIPEDNMLSFALAWDGAPVLNNQCQVVIPAAVVSGGAEDCGSAPCSSWLGFLPSALTTAPVSANASGLTAQINKFNSLGLHQTRWQVGNGTENVTISRYLALADAPPAEVRAPVVSLTPSTAESMPGLQAFTSGCTGNSCNENGPASMAAGNDFTCALTLDTRVRCWGRQGASGKLGNNNTTGDTNVPTPVKSPDGPFDLYGMTAVSLGSDHACGLLANGQVACWGSNNAGQLGNNTFVSSPVPVYVHQPGGGSRLSGIVALSAGKNHTCALNTARELFCWGDNDHGQLGDGSTVDREHPVRVQKVTAKTGSTVDSSGNLTNVFSVAAGGSHTCAVHLDTDGSTIFGKRVLCWGANTYGQTGDNDYHSADVNDLTKVGAADGAADARLYPVLVRDSADAVFTGAVAVTAGDAHSCALTEGGAVRCWGRDQYGQLGHAQSGDAAELVEAIGGGGALSGVAAVTAGANHTCALLTNRKAACWGRDHKGQLGNSVDQINADSPEMVLGTSGQGELSHVFALASGHSHSCAMVSGGYIHCFGSNDYGESGVTTAGDAPYPNSGVTNVSGNLQQMSLKECGKIYSISVP